MGRTQENQAASNLPHVTVEVVEDDFRISRSNDALLPIESGKILGSEVHGDPKFRVSSGMLDCQRGAGNFDSAPRNGSAILGLRLSDERRSRQ